MSSYARYSTIHGLVYLVESKSAAAKLLWLTCIVASAIAAAALIVGNFVNWRSQPAVVTKVDFNAVQVQYRQSHQDAFLGGGWVVPT